MSTRLLPHRHRAEPISGVHFSTPTPLTTPCPYIVQHGAGIKNVHRTLGRVYACRSRRNRCLPVRHRCRQRVERTGRQTPVILEEVIVTAQKRAERLQDVPITISVLDGKALDTSTFVSSKDALSTIPGMAILTDTETGGPSCRFVE
jgi:hypothetical protein